MRESPFLVFGRIKPGVTFDSVQADLSVVAANLSNLYPARDKDRGIAAVPLGLFRNQLADQLLDEVDVLITVGYFPVEYEPGLWNHGRNRSIVHIDSSPVPVDYRDNHKLMEMVHPGVLD